MGGTMRLGAQDVAITANSLASFLCGGSKLVRERFRHRYEVDPAFIVRLEAAGLIFSGRHPKQPIMQVLELPLTSHPYFIGAQFHPELTSRPLAPQALFMGLLAAAIARRNRHLRRLLRDADGFDPLRPPTRIQLDEVAFGLTRSHSA